MLDRAAIESMLSEMDQHVSPIESLRTISKTEFLQDPKIHLLAERCFQLAIQCLLDVGYHLAARRGWERPEDGAAAIERLSERGVFPPGRLPYYSASHPDGARSRQSLM